MLCRVTVDSVRLTHLGNRPTFCQNGSSLGCSSGRQTALSHCPGKSGVAIRVRKEGEKENSSKGLLQRAGSLSDVEELTALKWQTFRTLEELNLFTKGDPLFPSVGNCYQDFGLSEASLF